MHLYKTTEGAILSNGTSNFLIHLGWDELINQENLYDYVTRLAVNANKIGGTEFDQLIKPPFLLPPVGSQEIWAAGVTYLRSRDARMEEAKDSGGGDFYQKVYEAERPELFFKALPHRVVTHGEKVYIRKDSSWNVPEPEITIYINSRGKIQGYTIGNDMSSRSIEGENPLYLPQAKVYDKSAALGPCIWITNKPISKETKIGLVINRGCQTVFEGSVQVNKIKRSFAELVEYLYRECTFPQGCFLMTGTGIVPPDEFSLRQDDEIKITIEGIGTLTNIVSVGP